MTLHARAGELLLALVLFRLLWGVFGSSSARFSHFIGVPGRALQHLGRLFRREPDREAGHNPAGGWMALLLLVLLLLQVLTGLYIDNDIANEGPLTEIIPTAIADLISTLHEVLWYVLLGAVALHLAAVAVYERVKGHRLVAAMIHGRKTLPDDVAAPRIESAWRALALAIGAAALALTLTVYL